VRKITEEDLYRPGYVVLVVDEGEASKEALKLLEEAGINVKVENNGIPKDPKDGPLPWLITGSNGAFTGLEEIKWYIKTFGGTPLAY